MINPEVMDVLKNQQYRIISNHSSVKICHWTKKSLTTGEVCYKEKWYPPVKSHRCMQLSLSTLWCLQRCLWCWRLQSGDRPNLVWKEYPFNPQKVDDPKEILDRCIMERMKLLSGFKGNEKVDKKRWDESINPLSVAISLVGESCLYPKLDEFIQECHKRKLKTFLVTSGTLPQVLENLHPLPWQLYITLPAPDEKTYIRVCRPLIPNGWEKINETLELFSSLNCRKVVRLTLVKKHNLKNPEKYAKLILKAEPQFVECKAFMHVGEAQKRLPRSAMPEMKDIKEFADKLSRYTNYEIKAEDEASRVILLSR